MREVGNIQPLSGQDVALTKRVDVAPAIWIEPLVDIHVEVTLHVDKASVARPARESVHGARYGQRLPYEREFQRYVRRLGKSNPLEGLDGNVVGNGHRLATPGDDPADVDLMRTIHKLCFVAA